MKIGLLTVYYSNYGSYYQTVSLAKQLEAMGHQCEIVNASIRGRHVVLFMLGSLGERFLPRRICDWVSQKSSSFRTYHALRAELDVLNIGPVVFSTRKMAAQYDCVLTGSDELWSATNQGMKFIPAYWGLGVNKPHISYGTSAVTLHSPTPKMEAKMIKGIQSFQALSVRDIETQEWVRKWTGTTPSLVLDPTLLNPFFGSPGTGGNGICVYGADFSPQHITLIKKFAQTNQMPLHALCWKHSWCDDFLEADSAGALQKYFSESDFCIVSTFHGTVFSLLHRRPFAAFSAPKRTTKTYRLLEQVGMESCFWDDKRTDDISFMSSYDQFDSHVKPLREVSFQYLQNALASVEESLGLEGGTSRNAM